MCKTRIIYTEDSTYFFNDEFSAVSAASTFAANDPLGCVCILRIGTSGQMLPPTEPTEPIEPTCFKVF